MTTGSITWRPGRTLGRTEKEGSMGVVRLEHIPGFSPPPETESDLSATVERTMEWQVPTFADVLEARLRISPHLRPTPLFGYATLDELLEAGVFVKHENHQPVGAFKVRGGVNLVSQLSADERGRGVIAASTGNHGQSIAFAARLFGVRATICVPEAANPVKVASMRGLGADLVFHGRDYDDAREHCEQLAREHGYRYVHSGNEPLLIAGVATHTLEILEEEPRIDTIIVPIGGGSGAAGACIVAKAINPAIKVIGVQSEAAPAAFRAWQERRLVEDRMETFAEGLATRTSFELPQRILWQWLDDFVLVSDDEIRTAQAVMIETTRNLVEAAGAAPLAAALRCREQLRGKRVALILSGGNASREQLLDVLGREPAIRKDAHDKTLSALP
jgi:threonine dehydratase